MTALTMSDEAYWSLPFVVAPVLVVGWCVLVDKARDHGWRSRAQAWLDRATGQVPPAGHLRASERPLSASEAVPGHVRVLAPGDVPVARKPWRVEATFSLAHVDRSFIDLLWGGNGWRPYDWQIDGDGYPHT